MAFTINGFVAFRCKSVSERFVRILSQKFCSKMDKSKLREKLTPIQYQVTQERGTEKPFSGCYNKFFERGTYVCVVCDEPLFSSDQKFDSGCGWPAFNEVLAKEKVNLRPDTSLVGGNIILAALNPDRIRTEVVCAKCSAHMGHVFDDGPKPTGKRFCINSASLKFIAENKPEQ